MNNGEQFDGPKPVDLNEAREARRVERVHGALVESEHRRIAHEEHRLTEIERPAFLRSFSQKYSFKNHQILFALSAAIRGARSENREYVYIRTRQEGNSPIEQLAIAIAQDIEAGPDDATKTEAIAILKHFFTHPAFRSLNAAFQVDIDGGVLLNWRTK